ncbi:hypothetical protein [Formosa sp. A9]|uniref:hypothetical protein n=1 Tax=Formosa sp. A9 TaxID=3442641 RepID=UPI003EB8160B
MVFLIIIGIVIVLFALGVFDSKSETEGKSSPDVNPWKYNKTTAQLYFDIYVSEPINGNYFILKIGKNNFAALDVFDYHPEKSEKNELLLEMDSRLYRAPERYLSTKLGICMIKSKSVKLYFADKSLYHNGIENPPFEYMSLEGSLRDKTLILDVKRRYHDQVSKSSKIETIKENVQFSQL